MIDKVRARRVELAAEVDKDKAEYDRVEGILRDLGRAIDAKMGGLRELLALEAELEESHANSE